MMRRHHVSWCGAALVVVAWALVLAFAIDTGARAVFSVLLAIIAFLLLLAGLLYWLARRHPDFQEEHRVPLIGPHDTAFALLLYGAAILLVVLTIRLLSVKHFGGNIADLDFGDSPVTSSGQNLAFTADSNTFWHCIQGCVLLLWFPVINAFRRGICMRAPAAQPAHLPLWPQAAGLERVNIAATALLESFRLVLIVYPFYNVIKRVVKHGSEFAMTSYANNGMEWAVGVALGAAAGLVLTAAGDVCTRGRALQPPCDSLLHPDSIPRRVLNICSVIAGCALQAAGFFAGCMYAGTWHTSTPAGSSDLTVVRVCMVLVPALMIVGEIVVVVRRVMKGRAPNRAPAVGPVDNTNNV